MARQPKLVDDDLFTTTDEGLALLGATCTACATTTFPAQPSCPRCMQEAMAPRPLPRRGRLWSWTVQRFEPKPPYRGPQPFTPYGVGYVDLDGLVLVETRLTESDPTALHVDALVELTLDALPAEDGEIATFAFSPVASEQPHE